MSEKKWEKASSGRRKRHGQTVTGLPKKEKVAGRKKSGLLISIKARLTRYLLLCVLIAGFASAAFIYAMACLALDQMEGGWFENQKQAERFQNQHLKDLKDYIKYHHVGLGDIDQLRTWSDMNQYVDLVVYYNGNKVFCSYAELYSDAQEDGMPPEEELYKLKLADGRVVYGELYSYDYWKYYYYICYASVAVGVVLFVGIFSGLLRRKMSYIYQIEEELRILQGGNLEYPITVQGKDEIGDLARGIETMRLSIIENMKREKLLLQANRDLVTALSHDLRTPLTTLTGYLEILNLHGEKSEAEKKRYLELSLAKSREIRQLSDELFEYFLVYGEADKMPEIQEVSVFELVEELIGSQFFYLEEAGYRLESQNSVTEASGFCSINANYMQRVVNNLLSNLEKYADIAEPIVISTRVEQGRLEIAVTNSISKEIIPHESTRIGLITCERIMGLHSGGFEKVESDSSFTVKLWLPVREA